jgi:hypothetical protein
LLIADMTTAIERVLAVTSERASALGLYPTASIAALTSAVVSSLTLLVPFTTCETVAIETPAARATSAIVGIGGSSLGWSAQDIS